MQTITLQDQAHDHIDDATAARYARHTARVLLGLVFFVFGLNGFLHFIPEPKTPMADGVVAFLGGLTASGYLLPLLATVETLGGALLLTNRFVPLALALLAPVVVNIVLFHLVLESSGTVVALVVLALELGLAWSYRGVYRPMLASRVK
jgi:uncharacterized membrane protein YphA (DoxX/SURF4 family)